MKGKDAEPAMEQFVTPVVTDQEGRRLSRTMRSTNKLQDLMRFYYDMVPTVEDGDGLFVHRGNDRLLYYNKMPADYNLKDGDEIRFLPEISPRVFVTAVIVDFKRRQFTRTMRRTDKIQSLMNYYYAMVPTARYHELVFVYQNRFPHPEMTLAELGVEDEDETFLNSSLPGLLRLRRDCL